MAEKLRLDSVLSVREPWGGSAKRLNVRARKIRITEVRMKYFNKDGTPKRQKVRGVTGVTIGGKTYRRFAEIKTKPAAKIGPKERARRGIALAIL